jgi:2-desacetyl-2-hydroxyethyl bacteriochlorophyllide A dehydrogenase
VKSLWFTGPRRVEVRDGPSAPLPADGLRVRTEVSAISAGTELLFYRGELEEGVATDVTLNTAPLKHPFQYGYASVGRVLEAAPDWKHLVGMRVFGFHPHQEEVVGSATSFIPVPLDVSAEAATFLANMETAVSLLMDGAPLLGERVAVVGHGVVGQLTTALLTRMGVEHVHVIEPQLERGVGRLLSREARCSTTTELTPELRDSFDLVYELSGKPEAFETALQLARYSGRVVVGSWYGNRRAPIDLGSRVHRSRISVLFSQVSTIDPRHTPRFDKTRRLQVALGWLSRLPLESLITHRVPFVEAPRAYELLDSRHPGVLQVLLTHR